MKKIYLLLFIIIFSSSCKTKKDSTSKINNGNINFSKILEGSHSNFKDKDFILINSKEQLQKIYGTLNSTRMPGFEIPKINFDKEQVIGFFMGTKTTGGYSISLDHIKNEKDEILVFFTEKTPSGMATSVITQPFYLAKMVKTSKPVKFIIIE